LYSAIVIGFEEPAYKLKESGDVSICIQVTKPPIDQDLTLPSLLFFSIQPILNTAGKFYFCY